MRSRTHSFTRGLRRPRSRKYAGPCIFIYISFTIYIYIHTRGAGDFGKLFTTTTRRALHCAHGAIFVSRANIRPACQISRAPLPDRIKSRVLTLLETVLLPPPPIIDKITYRIVSRYKFTWLTEQIISIDLEITYRMERGFGIT